MQNTGTVPIAIKTSVIYGRVSIRLWLGLGIALGLGLESGLVLVSNQSIKSIEYQDLNDWLD